MKTEIKIIHAEEYSAQFKDKCWHYTNYPHAANWSAPKELNEQALKNIKWKSVSHDILYTTYFRAFYCGNPIKYLIQSSDNINNHSIIILN